MNTPSDRIRSPGLPARLGGLALVATALWSCIQGPWDYYPKNPPTFRGIWVSGYAMAGKPIRQVCMERFLALTEERTDAFPFYDSADVRITGRFSGATRTLALSRRTDLPNCFTGDTAALVERGQDYHLEARVVWDSAGKVIVDTLTARAQVPDSFDIRPTAVALAFTETGGLPPNILSIEFYEKLPKEVKEDPRVIKYQAEFLQVAGDSVKREAYIKKNLKSVQDLLRELLGKKKRIYNDGDEVFYLGGILNTFSHYYTSDRSEDVAGVLITHRFDSTAGRPETAFDSFFGEKPDTADYYFEGSIRRLGMYPALRTPQGYDLLDSIGVVNTWFHTGLNRLYFYGMEQAYRDYVETAIEGEGDPRIRMRYNVKGGNGFFVGGVPDSFDVRIKVDEYTQAFPMPEARAFECNKEGWDTNQDCFSYYRPYCRDKAWKHPYCGIDAIRANYEGRLFDIDSLVAATDSAAAEARSDTAALGYGTRYFCAENDFPALEETCDGARRDCNRPGVNGCKEALWNYCKFNQWKPGHCLPALAWYCRDKRRPSEVMCKAADAYCRDNPDNPACK